VLDENTSYYTKIFSDICRGYSSFTLKDKVYFIKHLTLAEQFALSSNYQIYENKAKALGLFSEKDQINFAVEQGWWSIENEEKTNFFRKVITNLKKTREKLVYKSQKEAVDAQIKQNEAMLLAFLKQRNDLLVYTTENYINKKIQEELFKLVLFKDSSLKECCYCDNDLYEEEDIDLISEIAIEVEKAAVFLKNDSIKRVAASGFFQNLIFLSETAHEFWGKPVTQCSKYQIDVLLYGKSYRNFIRGQAESGKALHEDIVSDPEKLISFVENYNPNSKKPFKKTKGENAVSSYVGATQEDLKDLGVQVEKVQGHTLLDLARKSGGVLEKDDYLKARG